MFNTGDRVQEVLNLRRRDVRVDAHAKYDCTAKAARFDCARYGRQRRDCCET